MYAGHVACCALVSHVEYASRAILRLEKKTGQTDGRMPDRYITLTATCGQRNNTKHFAKKNSIIQKIVSPTYTYRSQTHF